MFYIAEVLFTIIGDNGTAMCHRFIEISNLEMDEFLKKMSFSSISFTRRYYAREFVVSIIKREIFDKIKSIISKEQENFLLNLPISSITIEEKKRFLKKAPIPPTIEVVWENLKVAFMFEYSSETVLKNKEKENFLSVLKY